MLRKRPSREEWLKATNSQRIAEFFEILETRNCLSLEEKERLQTFLQQEFSTQIDNRKNINVLHDLREGKIKRVCSRRPPAAFERFEGLSRSNTDQPITLAPDFTSLDQLLSWFP